MSSPNSLKMRKNTCNEECLPPLNGIVQAPIIPPSNRPGRRTNVLDEIKIVVNALMRNRCSYHFRKPLGTNPMDVPNYHMLIKQPMDLSTILRRLNNNYYWQGKEAVEDVKLIFENCKQFNQEGSQIYKAGEELKSVFYRYVASLDMTREKEVKENSRGRRPNFRRRRLSRSASCPSE
ncbi:homeotic protein female sterile-like [Drosophila serrata]|uniref:homeotic protein female sterile-like n=1 Tax=Drosophila serrata TaxID=7274 RepID=UPI000A1D0E2B|nr:homeotic protein female sterile-like [Drosophila serrata]KAH8374912.1 hypothetical protein KR200_008577 [Drosophila serrata]